VIVEAIDPSSYDDEVDGLGALLLDAVDGGASVNFLAGATKAEACAWWAARSAAVADGTITVFVAREGERIIGSTLLERSRNPNSPHRAEIGKVIVHRSARRQGLGRALMRAVEERARSEGRWMLVLDTVTGSPAAALYESLGWQTVGTIPDYALDTRGEPEAATYYYKDLR
jgi:ribosomal protein S18 acetylase RimI-like enzyme